MERDFNYEIMESIKSRWSSRSFKKKEFTQEDILPLLEAARYAPSAFNEQPWFFLTAVTPSETGRVVEILTDKNKIWAKNASAFIIILSRKNFSHNNSSNRWHCFDAGTSFGFMTLEAEKRGVVLHPMAGFNRDRLISDFSVPEDYEPITVIAAGLRDEPSLLPPDLMEREKPGLRNALSSIYRKIEEI